MCNRDTYRVLAIGNRPVSVTGQIPQLRDGVVQSHGQT